VFLHRCDPRGACMVLTFLSAKRSSLKAITNHQIL